jgi:hypothetical protein
MSPLFRKSDERKAQQAAAQAEYERLSQLPPSDLAALILPAFGRDQKRPANGWIGASEWLLADYPRGVAAAYVQRLRQPVTASIQGLEHAGLLEQDRSNVGTKSRLTITVLGETALSECSARSYL